ncbi:hypothetical protein C8R43DRAFT_890005 [Mycena crocata]|nr:hypothetical protein C8R43DRAFT_890005 [Mycena crocata]
MAAFHHQPPTTFDVDEDTHTSSATPTRRRVRDPNIDPDLYTPSKRMRMMTGALSSTSSGSFLVGSSKVTSISTIPEPILEGPPSFPQPDWDHLADPDDALDGLTRSELLEYAKGAKRDLRNAQQHIHARDGIIESSHATIVVQNLFVKKQSQALFSKESKKKTKRSKLSMEGRGRHLTGAEWMEKTAEAARAREEEAAEKIKRAGDRETAKLAKEELARQWKVIQENHERAVATWKLECDRLTAAGVKKKDLPKKPIRPLKPKPAKTAELPDNSDGEESGSDDE